MVGRIKSTLSHPALYRALQATLRRSDGLEQIASRHVAPTRGNRVLDIGCGTADILPFLGDVEYVGFDPSHRYVGWAESRYGPHHRFFVGSIADVDPESLGMFDRVIAIGVLHHLDPGTAITLFAKAAAVLEGDGVLVTIDPCVVPGQSRVARWLIERDRGGFVRGPNEYRSAAQAVFSFVDLEVRDDLARVPYTHAIMRCSS